jgi:hypothetical protein
VENVPSNLAQGASRSSALRASYTAGEAHVRRSRVAAISEPIHLSAM